MEWNVVPEDNTSGGYRLDKSYPMTGVEELVEAFLSVGKGCRNMLTNTRSLMGVAGMDGRLLRVEDPKGLFAGTRMAAGSVLFGERDMRRLFQRNNNAQEPVVLETKQQLPGVLKEYKTYAVPVHNHKKRSIGALFIVIHKGYSQDGFLGMLTTAAWGIEKELQFQYSHKKQSGLIQALTAHNHGIVRTASVLSHEFCNSLTNVSAFIQLLKLNKSLGTVEADRLLGELARTNKLVDYFKCLTRPASFKMTNASLSKLLCNVTELMRSKADMQKVTVDLAVPPVDISICMDKDAIQQVFMNLIENALQAMEKGGCLQISLRYQMAPARCCIEFRDSGMGMSPEQLKNIFELFYTTKRNGTGIGLYLCAGIIKAHGGTIQAESAVDKGTVVTIILPGDKC